MEKTDRNLGKQQFVFVHKITYRLVHKLYMLLLPYPRLRHLGSRVNRAGGFFKDTQKVIMYSPERASCADSFKSGNDKTFIYNIHSEQEIRGAYKDFLASACLKKRAVFVICDPDGKFLRKSLEQYQSEQISVISQEYCSQYENLLREAEQKDVYVYRENFI